jgi:xanthine dehydrogenase/oxidase
METKDEELFATEYVHFYGQPIGLILADTLTIATAAAKLVKIEYEKMPAIFTIEEAISAGSFFQQTRELNSGVYAQGKELDESGLIFVEGEARMSGQEHFYLESNIIVVK